MKQLDKQFWGFAKYTAIYTVGVAVVLNIILISDFSGLAFCLLLAGIWCVSSLLAWFVAAGRHWAVFALADEVVFVALLSACMLLSTSMSDESHIETVLFFLPIFAFFAILPVLGLAYFGYNRYRSR